MSASLVRCPGCGRKDCPHKRLECGGEAFHPVDKPDPDTPHWTDEHPVGDTLLLDCAHDWRPVWSVNAAGRAFRCELCGDRTD